VTRKRPLRPEENKNRELDACAWVKRRKNDVWELSEKDNTGKSGYLGLSRREGRGRSKRRERTKSNKPRGSKAAGAGFSCKKKEEKRRRRETAAIKKRSGEEAGRTWPIIEQTEELLAKAMSPAKEIKIIYVTEFDKKPNDFRSFWTMRNGKGQIKIIRCHLVNRRKKNSGRESDQNGTTKIAMG